MTGKRYLLRSFRQFHQLARVLLDHQLAQGGLGAHAQREGGGATYEKSEQAPAHGTNRGTDSIS